MAAGQAAAANELSTAAAPILRKLEEMERRLQAIEDRPQSSSCTIL